MQHDFTDRKISPISIWAEKGPQGETMNIQYSKYVKYEIFGKSGIIAILSWDNSEGKHMHTLMSESPH